jgi:hypothetical protein
METRLCVPEVSGIIQLEIRVFLVALVRNVWSYRNRKQKHKQKDQFKLWSVGGRIMQSHVTRPTVLAGFVRLSTATTTTNHATFNRYRLACSTPRPL